MRHHLLYSTCIVVCQTDAINRMSQKPILSGRIGKWAYALVEYNLSCESLKSMRGQIVTNFIVKHRVNEKHDLKIGHTTCTPWKLYFDGSVCDNGQGFGVVLISSSGAIFGFSNRLKEDCTNNQSWVWSRFIWLRISAIYRCEPCWSLWWFTSGGAESIQGMLMLQWIFKCISWQVPRYYFFLWWIYYKTHARGRKWTD